MLLSRPGVVAEEPWLLMSRGPGCTLQRNRGLITSYSQGWLWRSRRETGAVAEEGGARVATEPEEVVTGEQGVSNETMVLSEETGVANEPGVVTEEPGVTNDVFFLQINQGLLQRSRGCCGGANGC